MPYVESTGIRPAAVFNPHGLPSRMTAGQLIESLVGKVCAIKGTTHDATIFKEIDLEAVAEELEQYGMHRYGYDRMINGITGEYIDILIFHGPTYYQRLQKFVADAEYSVRQALTDAVTLQPLDGAGSGGGLTKTSPSWKIKFQLVYYFIVVGKTLELRGKLVVSFTEI